MPIQQTADEMMGDLKSVANESLEQDDTLTQEQKAKQQAKDRLFNFQQVKPRLDSLKSKWSGEIQQTFTNRLIRKVDLNPKKLRDDGKIKEDETIIPIRLIDTNISREKPAYINYLTTSQRLNIFKCIDDTLVDTQALEAEWTDGMRYEEWNVPHLQCLDGAQVHGWSSMEVVYDESKPLHVALECIGHENLFFGLGSLDIQKCELLIRHYSFSVLQLRECITKYGFDKTQVETTLQAKEGQEKLDDNLSIYKVMFKFEETVYVAWLDFKYCTDWLKSPTKLYLGIRQQVTQMVDAPNPAYQQAKMTMPGVNGPAIDQLLAAQGITQTIKQPKQLWVDADIKMFPVFILPYNISEELQIVSSKGRVFYDQFMQEAMTAIATGFTNNVTRSSNIYGSVKNQDPTSSASAAPQQLDTPMSNGALLDQPIEFFRMPAPDPSMLQSLQYFETQNASDQGDVAFAVNNRRDSRKTAREISAASQQQQLLSSVDVVLYSIFLRKLYNFCWLIVQSQALQGKVKLLANIDKPTINFQTQQQEVIKVNNVAIIGLHYQLFPAGDVDVIQRETDINNMRQDWPVYSQTALAQEFLKEFTKKRYPMFADKWIAYIDQQMDFKQLLQQVLQAGQMLADPAKLAHMTPQQHQQLQQLMAQVQKALQPQTPLSTSTQQQRLPNND